jgi:hypothetical protein
MFMGRSSRWARVAAAAALGIGPFGCEDAKPPTESSLAEAKVHGTVKAMGKLVTDGEVVFNPANRSRKDVSVRSTPIRKDGTYEITTLVGQNSIRIGGPPLEKNPQLGYGGLTYTVTSGDNTFNIELPSK